MKDVAVAFIVIVLPLLPAQTPHGTMNEETPGGMIDGANNTFTIAHQPLPWSAIKLYRNGVRQTRCVPPPAPPKPCDYNLDTSNFNATKIVFVPIAIVPPGTNPQPGDTLLVDYTY